MNEINRDYLYTSKYRPLESAFYVLQKWNPELRFELVEASRQFHPLQKTLPISSHQYGVIATSEKLPAEILDSIEWQRVFVG